ncbi:hypothetical protein POPTR_005G031500v4 [Populus trichocarpa]|uniref:Uncharacterized protein n=1 Tax=Populus trichocarpa TaxID=3694 RepID=A0ACC0SXH0_POPTR|nr:hypothetical protein POPTR_005G031500v4 [Populus trichocarpa]
MVSLVDTGETINSEEESVSNRIRQVSPSQGPRLPILQKIINLSDKIQNLKKEHSNLSNQVKTAKDSFLGPNILDTLQKLGNEYELLKKKYLQELSERKRLYNEVIELKGNIRVFCRCRPLNQVEITNGSNYVVEFDSSQDNELQIISSDSSKKQFKFDHVFGPEDNQEAVFAQTKPIVASVLDGYNVCIFEYGQTGTGKTFAMEGSPENRGVNYRTLDELFSREKWHYEIWSFLLEIKQTAEGTQEVPGLVETRVTGTEDVWDLLKSGSRARSLGSTSANELSSRSHRLLRVTVKGVNLIDGQKTRSHLWMVDLAGSERVGKIDVEDLYYFNLLNNRIRGEIPDSIGNLSVGLATLQLPYNHLDGTIPATFGKLKLLQRLYLGRNKLQGSIPDEMGQMENLGLLDLANNSITGSILHLLSSLMKPLSSAFFLMKPLSIKIEPPNFATLSMLILKPPICSVLTKAVN